MYETSFGKYRLVAELGQGGMADVILAVAQGPVGFNKLVVLKRLRQHLADDPEFVGMLMDEARLAARLNHPNIVLTNEVGEIDGRFFMAMEYLEGQPLTRIRRRALRRGAPLGLGAEIRILTEVLSGLHYAHELTDYDGSHLGIVHRDVTPSNIFVTYDGQVKVLDFGIAKATGRTTETRTGVVKGKMTYMPPEQAIGLDLDRRADLFSVGVMLWEACAGQRMWKGLDDVVILSRLIGGDVPRSPRAVNPEVPEALDAICQRALSPEPDGRYATALEFQSELESACASLIASANHRALAQVVTELFASERKEIRAIVERQLSKMMETAVSSLEPVAISDSTSQPFTVTKSSVAGIEETQLLPGETSESTLEHRRSRSFVGLGLAAAAAAVLGLWLVQRPDVGEGTPEEADATLAAVVDDVEPVPTASAEAVPSEVRVTLRALPAGAKFSIDGGDWIDNPHVGARPADDAEHVVVISAKGYETKKVPVTFESDVLIDVMLEKKKTARRRYVRRRRPPPPPAPPPSPRPSPEREIFTDDPWSDR